MILLVEDVIATLKKVVLVAQAVDGFTEHVATQSIAACRLPRLPCHLSPHLPFVTAGCAPRLSSGLRMGCKQARELSQCFDQHGNALTLNNIAENLKSITAKSLQ